ncbi:glutaminyl-peptide cyclotransferase [Nocardia blacklockiae]|uniref:glutaminyl-peptide cyclotransferase n=1 Tax=Nocardia blacklockiae TaxID=480036 RepID=UPI001895D88B|nr:glutaminyl-peptide cyclotransferase [Nocardia blacklockiae]MBF6171653.1 glutaminyl-peptide cyclotransferase [Nocardia blacklockiae]
MKRKRRAWAATGPILLAAMAPGAVACAAPDSAQRLRVEVVATHPHDRAAFTEGLERVGDVLYESTGLAGRSDVRATDAAGRTVTATLPAEYFGEGVTKAGATVWQLTWKNETAFARDPDTLAERGRVHYDGEGWGLCTRGDRLVMSNGTGTLTFRDPVTFAPTGSIRLTSHQKARLNELDCAADGSVYANVWPTDHILHIDPDTGTVLDDIDAGGLLSAADRAGTDVLNGIAQVPGTDHFLVTGKYWPVLFEVRFVPA